MKRYKYIGKEKDEETGLYYMGARYYAPWLSRWCAVDPLQSSMPTWSSYNYGFDNPITWTDPTGMAPGDGSGDEKVTVAVGGSITTDVDSMGKNMKQVAHSFRAVGENITQSISTTTAQVTSTGVAVQQIRVNIFSRGDSVYSSTTEIGKFEGSLTDAIAAFPDVDFSKLDVPAGTIIGGETIGMINPTEATWETIDSFDAAVDGGPISWGDWVDRTQGVLDIVGLIPGLGEVADVTNGIISLARGNYAEAGLSFLAAIPVIGSVFTGVKTAKKVEGVYDILVKNTDDIERYIGQSTDIAKRSGSHFGSGGKLSTFAKVDQVSYAMKGSTKYEREVYEQYLTLKGGGINKGENVSNLLNKINPVGGRFNLNTTEGIEKFNKAAMEVIKKYNLPF